MLAWSTNTVPLQRLLSTGVMGLVAVMATFALAACGRRSTAAMALENTPVTTQIPPNAIPQPATPPIDALQPTETDTATFALG